MELHVRIISVQQKVSDQGIFAPSRRNSARLRIIRPLSGTAIVLRYLGVLRGHFAYFGLPNSLSRITSSTKRATSSGLGTQSPSQPLTWGALRSLARTFPFAHSRITHPRENRMAELLGHLHLKVSGGTGSCKPELHSLSGGINNG